VSIGRLVHVNAGADRAGIYGQTFAASVVKTQGALRLSIYALSPLLITDHSAKADWALVLFLDPVHADTQ
jgi:hypothetical protein